MLVLHNRTHLTVLEQAAAQGEDAPLATFGFCPVRCIRDASTNDQRYIGDFGLTRTRYEWVVDEQERQGLADANKALPACDPTIIWTIGGKQPSAHAYERSSHHRSSR